MKTKTNIINFLIERYNLISYLELENFFVDENFEQIKSKIKIPVGISASKPYVLKLFSDEFFQQNRETYDIILVNGTYENKQQSYKDISNSMKYLNENGFIIVYGCNPAMPEYKSNLLESKDRNNLTYKSFIRIKGEYKNWSCFVIDEGEGIGIITKRNILNNTQLTYGVGLNFDWEGFDKNRKDLLQIISFEEFEKIILADTSDLKEYKILRMYTHTQFGDHLMTYGIVKEVSKICDKLILSTKNDLAQFPKIKRLFSSIDNVILTTQRFEDNQYDVIISSQWWFEQVLPWYRNPRLPYTLGENMIFDRFWYLLANLPFNLKWDNFYFKREIDKEKEIFYDILKLKDDEPFIFLHEDPVRNMLLNREPLDHNVRIIEFGKMPEINILDILYTVEKATEVHTFNTGLLSFIDLMNIQHGNLNYHKYVRPNPVEQIALRLNWNTIDIQQREG